MSTRTGSPEPSAADPDELVGALNALLAVLSLERIQLESPQDLTPSLLLAVLESMLRARLPVPPETRAARTKTARIEAMKVFLAVLETDVLHEDVGIADVDPRRLADGEWDECVFVAELLVWLARDMQYLPDEARQQEEPRAESSSMAASRSAAAMQEPDRSTATTTVNRPPMHAHKDSVTSMRTADSNPFIVRPRPRGLQQPNASTSYSMRRSYSPPSPMPSSHPSRSPSPTTATQTGSSLGLSFRPPRASSPARLPDDGDEEDGDHTQLCTCDPDASSASSATFCTCSHAGDDDHPPPPPDSPPTSRRRGSTPAADEYSRRRSAEPASRRPSFEPSTSRRTLLEPSSARRISQPPASRRSSSARRSSLDPASARRDTSAPAPVRYDGWIERVEGDVEAFEAAHPPQRRRPLARYYPVLTPGGARNPTRHVSPAQHTLALMNERARLLGELAKIRGAGAGRTR
ncbi:hypothetical protein AURDEDRAFT_184354 [Auricularia subglabra TFB-10046 SS5]|nr:hypothetical protein AURDEDRAFT_184354 [Auricularia subglabra TFB-10046 SS5]